MARPRAADHDAKKHALLTSAAATLARHGVGQASMALIAREAKVSKALLYHYYPGRDGLIFDIIHGHLCDLDAAVALADDPALAPRDRLRALIHAVLDAYRDADDCHVVQINGTASLPPDMQARILTIERRITRRFAECLRANAPDLPPGHVMPVTMSLFGMLNWVYMWFRDGGPVSRDEYADLAAALILDGIGGVARP